MTEDERSIWEALVPVVVHPTKVTALEAMEWIERPLCANDIVNLINGDEPDDDAVARPLVSYHLTKLHEAGVLKLSHTKKVRGTYEKFYAIA